MEVLSSRLHESDYNYAFALGIKRSLGKFEAKLGLQVAGEEDESCDETIRIQDTIYNIRHVMEVVFKKILMHYREESVAAAFGAEAGWICKSWAVNFEELMLGPRVKSFKVPVKMTTKDILEKVDDSFGGGSGGGGNNGFWGMGLIAERETQLSDKFSLLLYNAVCCLQTSGGDLEISGAGRPRHLSAEEELLHVTSQYLSGVATNLSSALGLSQTSVMKMDSVVAEMNNSLGLDLNLGSNTHIQKVYEIFKVTVETHLFTFYSDKFGSETMVIVGTLREQGNNLMANQAYAQAIQVYTNAIDLCSVGSSEQLPQLLTNRAIAYIGLNCFPEAITDLNLAVNLDRTFTPAWTQLGYCHLYMGTSLVALKCYFTALRTAVGDVLPPSVVALESDPIVQKYRENKIETILPQFVHRVIQSIILTEKRAYQQQEPSYEIRSVVSNVRAILAKLRSFASDQDMPYYTYTSNIEDNSFRSVAERTNRLRPDILNQDVAQNILASNGVETSAIAIPANPVTSFERVGRDRGTNSDGNENTRHLGGGATTRNTGLGGLLNDFGDMLEGRNPITVDVTGNSDAADRRTLRRSERRTETRTENNTNPNGNTNTSASSSGNTGGNTSGNRDTEPRSVVRDVLRGFFPDNFAGSLGNIVAQSFAGTPGEATVTYDPSSRSGTRDSARSTSGSGSNIRNSDGGGTSGSRQLSSRNAQADVSRSGDDIDMPEVPDDLD